MVSTARSIPAAVAVAGAKTRQGRVATSVVPGGCLLAGCACPTGPHATLASFRERYRRLLVRVRSAMLSLREWYRNPLRRQMRTRPIAFRTELDLVRFPEPTWWWGAGDETRGSLEVIIRGDMVRVGTFFGLVIIGQQCYFRAPET